VIKPRKKQTETEQKYTHGTFSEWRSVRY